MLGNGCPVGSKVAEEGDQLQIFLAGPGVSEGSGLGELARGGGVRILLPRALASEGVMLGELVRLPAWGVLGLGAAQIGVSVLLAAG